MAIMSMPERITGGVDTHLDVHVAAALDGVGGLLGVKVFPADAKGYRALLGWLQGFGEVVLVGVEGTGSYGAGLTRHLHASGVQVVEVDRPNRCAGGGESRIRQMRLLPLERRCRVTLPSRRRPGPVLSSRCGY
jgi:hypothetical protein